MEEIRGTSGEGKNPEYWSFQVRNPHTIILPCKINLIFHTSFNVRRLENLTSSDIKIRPAINQVELSWHIPQPDLIAYAKKHNILLEAYSPLGSNDQVKKTLDVPEVKEVAAKLGISAAQVVISWLYQRGVVVLPKSVTPARIRENLQGASSSFLRVSLDRSLTRR